MENYSTCSAIEANYEVAMTCAPETIQKKWIGGQTRTVCFGIGVLVYKNHFFPVVHSKDKYALSMAGNEEFLKDAVYKVKKDNGKKSSVLAQANIINHQIETEKHKTNWAQVPQRNISHNFVSTNAQQHNNFDLFNVDENVISATDLSSEYQINKSMSFKPRSESLQAVENP